MSSLPNLFIFVRWQLSKISSLIRCFNFAAICFLPPFGWKPSLFFHLSLMWASSHSPQCLSWFHLICCCLQHCEAELYWYVFLTSFPLTPASLIESHSINTWYNWILLVAKPTAMVRNGEMVFIFRSSVCALVIFLTYTVSCTFWFHFPKKQNK